MSQRKAWLVATVVALGILGSACTSGEQTSAPPQSPPETAPAAAPAAAPEVSRTLFHGVWILESHGTAGKPQLVLAGSNVTAIFTAGEDPNSGRLAGRGGCNQYSASFTLSGEDAIKLSAAIATRMFCGEPSGIMEQEAAYLQALEAVSRYRIQGEKLHLSDEAGAHELIFTWQAAEAQK
jgi:heat shock protein HslJ